MTVINRFELLLSHSRWIHEMIIPCYLMWILWLKKCTDLWCSFYIKNYTYQTKILSTPKLSPPISFPEKQNVQTLSIRPARSGPLSCSLERSMSRGNLFSSLYFLSLFSVWFPHHLFNTRFAFPTILLRNSLMDVSRSFFWVSVLASEVSVWVGYLVLLYRKFCCFDFWRIGFGLWFLISESLTEVLRWSCLYWVLIWQGHLSGCDLRVGLLIGMQGDISC